MIWKGTHQMPHCWQCISELKLSNEVKETACRGQIQFCIEAQIWGRLQKKTSCCPDGSLLGSTVASIILKQSNWYRRGISRLVKKNLLVTLVELHEHICRWEKPTEGQTSLQQSSDLGFMLVWPNSILSSVKKHENTLVICKTAPKGPSDSEKQDHLDEPQF